MIASVRFLKSDGTSRVLTNQPLNLGEVYFEGLKRKVDETHISMLTSIKLNGPVKPFSVSDENGTVVDFPLHGVSLTWSRSNKRIEVLTTGTDLVKVYRNHMSFCERYVRQGSLTVLQKLTATRRPRQHKRMV